MYRILLALGAVAIAAPCLAADNASISAVFGNTIVSTYPDGRTAELWLLPDGSYTGEGRRHDHSSGHWQVKDEKLCLKQSHPFAFGITYCTPIAHVGVGESWTGRAYTGETIRIKVVKGRYEPGQRQTAAAGDGDPGN